MQAHALPASVIAASRLPPYCAMLYAQRYAVRSEAGFCFYRNSARLLDAREAYRFEIR